MTRDDIEQELDEFVGNRPLPGTAETEYSESEMIEFAVEMVRRHNEECAQIANDYPGCFTVELVKRNIGTAKAIREAKP